MNGDVYDVSKFAALHPGGEQVILEHAGKDASEDARAQPHLLSAGAVLRLVRLLLPHSDESREIWIGEERIFCSLVQFSAVETSEPPGSMSANPIRGGVLELPRLRGAPEVRPPQGRAPGGSQAARGPDDSNSEHNDNNNDSNSHKQ